MPLPTNPIVNISGLPNAENIEDNWATVCNTIDSDTIYKVYMNVLANKILDNVDSEGHNYTIAYFNRIRHLLSITHHADTTQKLIDFSQQNTYGQASGTQFPARFRATLQPLSTSSLQTDMPLYGIIPGVYQVFPCYKVQEIRGFRVGLYTRLGSDLPSRAYKWLNWNRWGGSVAPSFDKLYSLGIYDTHSYTYNNPWGLYLIYFNIMTNEIVPYYYTDYRLDIGFLIAIRSMPDATVLAEDAIFLNSCIYRWPVSYGGIIVPHRFIISGATLYPIFNVDSSRQLLHELFPLLRVGHTASEPFQRISLVDTNFGAIRLL